MKTRHAVLALLLVGTAVAAFWPGRQTPNGVVEPSRHHRPAAENRRSAALPATSRAGEGRPRQADAAPGERARLPTKPVANLFPAQSFRPPPPPMPRLPPPPPMAPPLPFTFLGQWTDKTGTTVFLADGQATLLGRQGEVLAGGWRIDAITPEAVVFTYESLDQHRTLRIAP